MKNKDIIVIFQPEGLLLDVQEIKGKGYSSDTLLADFKADAYKALLYFGFADKHPAMSVSLSFLRDICEAFINGLSRDPDIERSKSAPMLEVSAALDLLRGAPYALGAEYLGEAWLAALWRELSAAFAREIAAWGDTVASFLQTHKARLNVVGKVFFHLVENRSEDYPFAFLATYSTEKSGAKKAAHVPLKNALIEYKDRQDLLLGLLSTVSKAADGSALISELVESGELFSPLRFQAEEAYTFLKEIPFYEDCGILCRMPDWWKKKSAGVKLSVTVGDRPPSMLGLEALVRCEPRLLLDGTVLTKDEVKALLAQTEGLSLLKGKWIEVDHEKLRSVLEAYERVSALDDMTLLEAMRAELGISESASRSLGDAVEITHGRWMQEIRAQLADPARLEALEPGAQFKASLRHYQQAGFRWLAFMQRMGFGALLADDMGLGKTIQILALLEYLRHSGSMKALLVIPASLIGNWEKELARFAPEIKYALLHAKSVEIDETADLFITTYGMALRLEALRARRWDVVILDEAQAIKNPAAAQTKAIKQLRASFKIAMTGTPIENKLGDLWSLFDFLNTGLLGTAKEFTSYAKRLKESGSYARLRSVVAPFTLRRLKTDKSILSDLPDKVEIKAYAAFSKKQAALYQSCVKELRHTLETADGIARKGLVLAAIMKFKQICNHPDQYLGQAAFRAPESGKFEKLREICETIYEKRERVLVFTQFKELTAPLAAFLSEVFEREGLVLHGGTAVKKRAQLVEQFNGADYVPFMVLSLKAGGVGLNLTAANHVIHFDRWWNPAVENQATDRAFRLGQTKNVMVHKFITAGTIEEKIDAMIEEKQKLSGDIIAASGERWITEMSNDELMRLVALEV